MMPFVIIASRRTGSTHLVTTLSGHPDIFCNGNIFKQGKMQLFWPDSELTLGKKKELLQLRRNDPLKFLNRVFEAGFGKPVVGFKIFRGQQDEMLKHLIADPTVRKIVLFRRNVLANYASDLSARETGQYSADQGKDVPQVKVLFDRDQFESFQKKYIGFYRRVLGDLTAMRQDYCFIDYEEINEPLLLSGVIGFAGGDMNATWPPDSQYRQLTKQGSNSIIARFSNDSVVRKYLKKNNLMHWAYEGAASLSEPDDKGKRARPR